MKMMIVLSVIFGSAFASADTHGGVDAANSEFGAAVSYAQNEAGTLFRIRSIIKMRDCVNGSVFKVTYASADSNGVEHASGSSTVRVSWDATASSDSGPIVTDSKSCK